MALSNLIYAKTWPRSKYWLSTLLAICLFLGIPLQAWAQSFPFNETQPLTSDQVLIQKYKLERLRVKQLRDDWFIIRGINEKIEESTLLKLTGNEADLEDRSQRQLIGSSVGMGGLVAAGTGLLMVTNVIKVEHGFWIGLTALIGGSALVAYGSILAGDLESGFTHIMSQEEARQLVQEYNQNLKKKIGVDHLPNLDP